jgi:hypothetical protein
MSCWGEAADVASCLAGWFVTGSVIDVDSGMYRG